VVSTKHAPSAGGEDWGPPPPPPRAPAPAPGAPRAVPAHHHVPFGSRARELVHLRGDAQVVVPVADDAVPRQPEERGSRAVRLVHVRETRGELRVRRRAQAVLVKVIPGGDHAEVRPVRARGHLRAQLGRRRLHRVRARDLRGGAESAPIADDEQNHLGDLRGRLASRLGAGEARDAGDRRAQQDPEHEHGERDPGVAPDPRAPRRGGGLFGRGGVGGGERGDAADAARGGGELEARRVARRRGRDVVERAGQRALVRGEGGGRRAELERVGGGDEPDGGGGGGEVGEGGAGGGQQRRGGGGDSHGKRRGDDVVNGPRGDRAGARARTRPPMPCSSSARASTSSRPTAWGGGRAWSPSAARRHAARARM
jgi:hypothetical protein